MNHAISLDEIKQARGTILGAAIRTPLVKLHSSTSPEIYLKLENLQPIGSFKIRGAANAIASLSEDALSAGVVTASAGNMAQGVAWFARKLGVPCTVIAPQSAPDTKVKAIERLGGRVVKVSFDDWWKAFEQRSFPGVEGAFVHAFDDPKVMAGNGTIALEILEDLSDVDAVVVPWGGGGLSCGIASALRALSPRCKVYAAEVDIAAPLAASLKHGFPTQVEHKPSFVDGIGAKGVFPQMFERAKTLLDGSLVASIEEVADAVRTLAGRVHVVAEGAGACSLACALSGQAGCGKIVCIVSGGNIDADKLCAILTKREIG